LLGPIFNREWLTTPRRPGHHVLRTAHLGFAWILAMTAWQTLVGWTGTVTLGDTARFGPILFQMLVVVQMTLLLFFSALSAASTITQEKDRRTFILLLLTDLRAYEIVLGKLCGSMLTIAMLVLGMVPLLLLVVLLGGVSPKQVGQATLVVAAASLAAGALGNFVALWREKTFQVLALTVLLLALYFCVVRGLVFIPGFPDVERWQHRLDPYLALQSVLDASTSSDDLHDAYGFAAVMFGITIFMTGWSMARLRIWNPSGEPIQQRERPEDAEEEERDRLKAHAAPGPVRAVWSNPIAWREIRTRAYGRRPLLVKAAYFLVLGMILHYALRPLASGPPYPPFLAAYGLLPVGILSLLLVSAQAVTSITTERDGGGLDLLLVTDLTPREFIYGKLLGIIWNTKEYLLPPLLLVFVYGWHRVLASPPTPARLVEATVFLVATILVLEAFTVVLGLHVALRIPHTRQAILQTLGTVFFLSAGTMVCIYLILINGRFEAQWASFVLFLSAGVGGLWWVLSAERGSSALTLASWACPPAVFYAITSILVGRPGSDESTDPLQPAFLVCLAFGFTVYAMMVPLLSEFDIALGRTDRPD
jgi:ABC-type Na+ efflux pump permease subunit